MDLLEAAREGNETLVQAALDAGADVNFQYSKDHERSALHNAAGRGESPACVRLLVGAGADVNIEDEGGCRPLHLAAETLNDDVIEALVDCGADKSVLNLFGHTPRRVAESVYEFCDENSDLQDNSNYDPEGKERVLALLDFAGAQAACRPDWPTEEQRAAKAVDSLEGLDFDFLLPSAAPCDELWHTQWKTPP